MALSKTVSALHQRRQRTLDGRPLDLLAHILFLLSLERELDKDLLQLFVDIVDAQLLERIVVENLESAAVSAWPRPDPLDVQNADHIARRLLWLHRDIDARDDPLKQIVVAGQQC